MTWDVLIECNVTLSFAHAKNFSDRICVVKILYIHVRITAAHQVILFFYFFMIDLN